MRKTITGTGELGMSTERLAQSMCCGRATAVRIGTQANARMQIGRRVLWNVARIQAYLDAHSGESVTEE